MISPGADDINPAVNTIHTLVAVEDTDGWRAALFQSTPAVWHGRPQDSAALTEELRDVMGRGLTCLRSGRASPAISWPAIPAFLSSRCTRSASNQILLQNPEL